MLRAGITRSLVSLMMFASIAAMAAAVQHEHGAPSRGALGTVNFTTSCSPAAQAQMNRAVALLHSFQFGPAIAGFNEALKSDASCGIAYWGIALSSWTNPMAAGARAPAQLRQ